MSQLEKLAILGVRSFDNTFAETIKFHTPLTLIVGPNGSGKTTIIECLKYATTGNLPPNSKGGAFIHDPSLRGEKIINAQVKMMFKSTAQTKMVVTRSLQLTVKKNSRTAKTLDGTLRMVRNGEKTTLSSKNAHLDKVMPQNLGVSTAILEYVIFCHQDESLWPLSEPAPLKKKFDEIFEAQKYTKAIENLKDIRKRQGQRLNIAKTFDTTAKERKAQADRAEKRAKNLSDVIEELRKTIVTSKEKSRDAKEKASNAHDKYYNYQKVVNALELSRREKYFHQENIEKLKRNLVQRSESDDWLRSELENYEQRVKEREEQQKLLKDRFSKLGKKLDEFDRQLSSKDKDQGRYEALEATHQAKLEERKSTIQRESRQYNIRGFEASLDSHQIDLFMSKITKALAERERLVETSRVDTGRDTRNIQESSDMLSARNSSLVAEHSSTKQQIVVNEQKTKALTAEISAMDVDEGDLVIADSRIEELTRRLERARDASRNAAWEETVHAHDLRLRSLRDQISQLNDELIGSTKSAGDLAHQEHLQNEISDRQQNLTKLRSVHDSKLKTLLDHQWEPSLVEADYDRQLEERGKVLSDAGSQRDSISRELDLVDAELSRNKTALSNGQQEVDICAKRIRDVCHCDPESYPQEFAQIQHDRDILKSDLEGAGYVQDYYKKAITMAEEKQKCVLCTRPFEEGHQIKDFIQFMERKIKKASDTEKAKEELRMQEELLGSARGVGIAFETWQHKTRTELPILKESEETLSSDRSSIIRRLEDQDKLVNDFEQAKADIISMHKPVNNISRYHRELVELSAKLSELKRKQVDAKLPRTLEEIRTQLNRANEESAAEAKAKEQLISAKDESRTKINDMELGLRDLKNTLEKSRYNLKEKEGKVNEAKSVSEATQNLRQTRIYLDQQMKDVKPQLEAVRAQLEDVRMNGDRKEKTLRDEASQMERSVNRLLEMNTVIQKYQDEGGSSMLDRCRREIEDLKGEKGRIEWEKNETIKEVNRVSEELKSQEQTKRVINDNLDYRDSLRQADNLQQRIDGLEAQNAEADRDQWKKEADHYKNQQETFDTETNSCLGAARSKDEELSKLLTEWETEYKDAEKIARKSHIEVEAYKAAIEDLATYTGALDKAIMKYHGLKMQEINRIIEELWKKTYQGTDVDTILIRSDTEAAKGNRSYNYRVCMIKQDVEMDMRGRCSAGQKVLASIIIRLALAECFGVNCGLIALDEPTTNLDADNISALARSLHDLIQARRHQANFQLIVITHDEEFLRQMQCPDFCDYFWAVKRGERDRSIIERQDISLVM